MATTISIGTAIQDKKEEKKKNLWLSKIVAFAYQYQKEARPFVKLIEDLSSLFTLKGGETVLDIGCGSGRLISLVNEKANGKLKKVVGLDCCEHAIEYAKKNLKKIFATTSTELMFEQSDVSKDLPFADNEFDVVTAGLSIQYAEHWDGYKWTDKAYHNIIKEVFRVLNSGGKFVFSVNTPNPNFSIIAKESWREILFSWRLPLNIIVSVIMVFQGRWLTKQANIGRFHYHPVEDVMSALINAGFVNIKYKLTYAGLAWVVSCDKPTK